MTVCRALLLSLLWAQWALTGSQTTRHDLNWFLQHFHHLTTHHPAAAVQAEIENFDEHYHGIDFILHQEYNLLLSIHHDKCFFMTVNPYLMTKMGSSHERHTLESQLSHIITDAEDVCDISARVRDGYICEVSSLGIMRDRYEDRLADFHCLDKGIFSLTFVG